MSYRIVFMGTPEYSLPTLSALIAAGHDVVGVYTQPPRPAGRGQGIKVSPVHQLALDEKIPVFTPVSLKGENEQKEFAALSPDIAVVVAYGLLLPQTVLDTPRFGCINAHASLLPRWRGAAPIQRAIEAGDRQTGVMIMQMEAGLDTGPVLMEEQVAIDETMNAGQLHDQLSELSGELMVRYFIQLANDAPAPKPQSVDGVTYAKKLQKSESHINWNRSTNDIHNHIRAMSPFPGAWGEMNLGGKPVRVKILSARIIDNNGTHQPGEILNDQLHIGTNNGIIQPVRLQKAGKKPADLEEFLRGNSPAIGSSVS